MVDGRNRIAGANAVTFLDVGDRDDSRFSAGGDAFLDRFGERMSDAVIADLSAGRSGHAEGGHTDGGSQHLGLSCRHGEGRPFAEGLIFLDRFADRIHPSITKNHLLSPFEVLQLNRSLKASQIARKVS